MSVAKGFVFCTRCLCGAARRFVPYSVATHQPIATDNDGKLNFSAATQIAEDIIGIKVIT